VQKVVSKIILVFLAVFAVSADTFARGTSLEVKQIRQAANVSAWWLTPFIFIAGFLFFSVYKLVKQRKADKEAYEKAAKAAVLQKEVIYSIDVDSEITWAKKTSDKRIKKTKRRARHKRIAPAAAAFSRADQKSEKFELNATDETAGYVLITEKPEPTSKFDFSELPPAFEASSLSKNPQPQECFEINDTSETLETLELTATANRSATIENIETENTPDENFEKRDLPSKSTEEWHKYHAEAFIPLPISSDASLLSALDDLNYKADSEDGKLEIALKTLASYRTQNSVEAVSRLARNGYSSSIRAQAVSLLAMFDHESVLETILDACADPEDEVRSAATSGLLRLSFAGKEAWWRVTGL
jgi:hypothetical protein